MDVAGLDMRLRRLWRRPRWRVLTAGDGSVVSLGWGAAGADYRWSGRARRDGPEQRAIVQVTVEGTGRFAAGGMEQRVGVGRCFLALVPSDHVYRFAPEDGRWRFCWVTASHPWYIERVRRAIAMIGNCPPGDPGPGVLAAMLQVHLLSASAVPPDPWSLERAILDLASALGSDAERLAAGGERARLLALVRDAVRAAPAARLSVADLARRDGRSRTAFAHACRSAIGSTPTQLLRETRVALVCERLADGAATLEDIAADCGFAAANHLCRVFRRVIGTSPARWRAAHRSSGMG